MDDVMTKLIVLFIFGLLLAFLNSRSGSSTIMRLLSFWLLVADILVCVWLIVTGVLL